jgi:N-formylglutamate deformylase
MSDCYTYHEGDSPLLVSVPHDGRLLPPDIAARMTPEALDIPDTDWHVGQLYDFCKDLNASMVVATHSRYVVDLNRSMSDEALYEGQVSTGLCPALSFGGAAIYGDTSVVTESEKERRVVDYWQPYHEKIAQRLQQLKDRFGYALLWDAHSIPSRVPSLFPGELAELNIGTNNGESCPRDIRAAVAAVAAASPYSAVLDGRFRGGFITRRYGSPEEGQYAIQLELAQRCYMNEDSLIYDEHRAAILVETLQRMLSVFAESAANEAAEVS